MRQNRLAAHLLRWWAYFDNEDIWLELLQADEEDGPAWIYELNDELSFNAAMGTLHDYGLVDVHIGTTGSTESRGYSIHSCVHSWTMHILNQNWDADLARLSIGCVASLVPSETKPQFWNLQRRLLSHAIRCHATIRISDHDMPWAFHSLGNLYFDQGKMDEAEAMYQRALQGYEKAWGPDHTSTLSTVNNLGLLYSDQGKMDEAEAIYQRALQGYEKALGAETFTRHRPALNTMQNLANLRLRRGQRIAARELYIKACSGLELLLGPQNASVQSLHHTISHLERSGGKLSNYSYTYDALTC